MTLLALALACESRSGLVDEARPLGTLEGSGAGAAARTWTWRATMHGWRYTAGWGDHGPHRAYDAVYVGWELAGDRSASVDGEVDQVWAFDALDPAKAAFDGLAVETCAEEPPGDRFAFRLTGGKDDRVRVVVPDRAGALVEVGSGGDCAAELAGIGTSDEWRRDRVVGVQACGHLYRLGLRQDAVRCELREPEHGGRKQATRQDLPSAPDDPRFDGEVLAALDPDAPGDRSTYAPYRVGQLLAEVRDRAALEDLARRIAASPERSAWRAEILGAAGTRDALSWVDEGADTEEEAAIAEILLTAFPDAERIRRMRGVRAWPDCGPPHQVAPGQCPDPGALPIP